MRVISPVLPSSLIPSEPAFPEWELREFTPYQPLPTLAQLRCLDAATSSSSATVGAGSHTFTTQANLAIVAGDCVTISTATASMTGLVTNYTGTTLVIDVDPADTDHPDPIVGSGTFSAWHISSAGGRLIPTLRDAVRPQGVLGKPLGLGNGVAPNGPIEILTRAAATFYLAAHPPQQPFTALPPPTKEMATALADLAVTGRETYAIFVQAPPQDATIAPLVTARLLAGSVQAAAADVAAAIKSALDRAYQVAHALRAPYPARVAAREACGWIAVSGEDDPPHRHVNDASANYTSYDLTVTVPSHPELPIATRFFIAPEPPAAATPQILKITGTGLGIDKAGRLAPVDPLPSIPAGNRVILFLHGAGSSAEEVASLIQPVVDAGARVGTNFSIIAVDLPSTGYSTMLAHEDIAAVTATTYPTVLNKGAPIATPVLDFIEDFVVAFVNQLDAQLHFASRFAGVIGGSLGGNLGLRLGERFGRHPADCGWLANAGIVSWSAASVWCPMVWILEAFPVIAMGEATTGETALSRASSASAASFTAPMAGPFANIMPSLPSQWYGDDWKGKTAFLEQAASGTGGETYNALARRWWPRVDCEQLIFSHLTALQHNTANQLLISGYDDNYPDPGQPWNAAVSAFIADVMTYLATNYPELTFAPVFTPFFDTLLTGLSGGTIPPGTLEGILGLFASFFGGGGAGALDLALHQVPPIPRIYDNTITVAGLMSGTPGRCLLLPLTGHSVHVERPLYLAREIARFCTHGAPTRPAACTSANGCLDLFVVDVDGSVRHKFQVAGTGGYVAPLAAARVRWSDWTPIGGLAATGSPAACLDAGQLWLMAIGTDGALHSMQQTTPSGGGPNGDGVWSGWTSHGGAFVGSPCLGQHLNGGIEAFVVGSDGALHNTHQTAPTTWSAWTSLGGSFGVTTPAVGRSGGSDVLEVMVVGKDGHLYHTWQVGTGWAAWYDHGGSFAGPPAIGRRGSDGALVVVVVGTDGQLYRKAQLAPNSTWTGWSALGGAFHGAPTIATSGTLLEVMVVGLDGHLHHMWENSPGAWSAWFDHGGTFASSPCVARRPDGALEAFCVGTDDWLWHKLQGAPNGGWGAWLSDLAIYHLHLPTQFPLVNSDRHFFTASQIERQQLLQQGWQDGGIAGYGLPAPAPGATPAAVPLFRWYKQLTNDHVYTTSTADVGYQYGREAVACYVYGAPADGTIPLHSLYRAVGQNHDYTTNDGGAGGYTADPAPACYLGAGLEIPLP